MRIAKARSRQRIDRWRRAGDLPVGGDVVDADGVEHDEEDRWPAPRGTAARQREGGDDAHGCADEIHAGAHAAIEGAEAFVRAPSHTPNQSYTSLRRQSAMLGKPALLRGRLTGS